MRTPPAADFQRLVAWAREVPRRPAKVAFTEGTLRWCAYLIEELVPPPGERTPPTALDEVAAERIRQDRKWGGPSHDDTHNIFEWWGFIKERMVGRAYPGGRARERRDLIEIAALAIAAVESMDRKHKPVEAPPSAPPPAETREERMQDYLGLTIDMLDVDRLRFGTPTEDFTDRLEQAVRDIGALRNFDREAACSALNQVVTLSRDSDCPEDIRLVRIQDVATEALSTVLRRAAEAPAETRCVCHSGSVCGPACAGGQHHDGCAKAETPCENECNPFIASCGARVCTMEDMVGSGLVRATRPDQTVYRSTAQSPEFEPEAGGRP